MTAIDPDVQAVLEQVDANSTSALALLRGLQDRDWPLTCGAKGTRTPGLLDANQTLFQLSYSPASSFRPEYPLLPLSADPPGPAPGSSAGDAHRRLLQQAGQAAVGERLAARLAGRAILECGVGEGHFSDGVAADLAFLACPAVPAQAALLLAFEIGGG